MKKQSLCLLLCSYILFLAACKKEEKSVDFEQQFIGTWQQISVEEKVNSGEWEDHTDACDREEIVVITDDKDHSLKLYSEHPAQCGDKIYIGRWDIFEDGKEMTWNLDGVAAPIKKEVVTVNETTLITIHDVDVATPTQIRLTYQKK